VKPLQHSFPSYIVKLISLESHSCELTYTIKISSYNCDDDDVYDDDFNPSAKQLIIE
jgi:hypothetical protein